VNKETELRTIISETTGKDISNVDLTLDLVEYLNLDSIDGLRVVAAIERKMKVRFPDESLGKLHTLEGILNAMGEAVT